MKKELTEGSNPKLFSHATFSENITIMIMKTLQTVGRAV